eukprot:scaffold905_cov363-Pavlova_lutheri.AAC.9
MGLSCRKLVTSANLPPSVTPSHVPPPTWSLPATIPGTSSHACTGVVGLSKATHIACFSGLLFGTIDLASSLFDLELRSTCSPIPSFADGRARTRWCSSCLNPIVRNVPWVHDGRPLDETTRGDPLHAPLPRGSRSGPSPCVCFLFRNETRRGSRPRLSQSGDWLAPVTWDDGMSGSLVSGTVLDTNKGQQTPPVLRPTGEMKDAETRNATEEDRRDRFLLVRIHLRRVRSIHLRCGDGFDRDWDRGSAVDRDVTPIAKVRWLNLLFHAFAASSARYMEDLRPAASRP